MKLNVFYGDTKHGNVVDCDSFEDAEKLIRESAGKGFANIVLNDKCRCLLDEEFSCSLAGAKLDFLSDMDVTAIFANLLDNALEAREREREFRLKIQGEQIQDFILIKIENPYVECPSNGKSTKPGHEGLGLQNVRQALGKYQGDMEIRKEEGIFSVTMLFAAQYGEGKTQ